MKINKNLCTEITNGTVVSLKDKGLNFPRIVTVEYQVDSTTYQISESIKLKSSVIKLGPIPIGQRKTAKINTRMGSKVKINYNPDIPSMAYLTDNKGIINN